MTPKPISEIQRVVDTVDKFREVHAGNENTYLFRLKDALDSISSALCVMNMKLEGKTTELLPQPVATLCEAVESVLSYLQVGGDNGNPPLSKRISIMRHALAHERKRAKLVDAIIASARSISRYDVHEEGICFPKLYEEIIALDAFDKGAENG